MRRLSRILPLLAALIWLQPAASALAQSYPAKPVRVITTSSAGGISDIFIRIVGDELHKRWGQPLVIENRAGGQFNIGARACADAAPAQAHSAVADNAAARIFETRFIARVRKCNTRMVS